MALTFRDPAELKRWLLERAKHLALDVKEVPLASLVDWSFEAIGLIMVAIKSAFYRVVGLRVMSRDPVVNIGPYDFIAIAEEGGYVGLIIDENGDLLIRAGPEPGYTGEAIELGPGVQDYSRVLLAPAIQFSLARLRKFGAAVPFADLLLDFDRLPDGGAGNIRTKCGLRYESQPADGWRFVAKTDHYVILQVDRAQFDAVLETRPDAANYAWADQVTVADLRAQGLCNAHLRGALSML